MAHGFFARVGGVSTGLYAELNCGFGSDDDRERVAHNRAICAESLGLEADSLVTVHQVHGVTVAEARTPWRPEAAPRADALVTRTPGLALGILTADCAPVLMADPAGGVIAAAHAGWKGAKSGVVEAAVEAMVGLGARQARIVASVGPAIAVESYEVGLEFESAFLADDPAASRFFVSAPGRRPHFDLQGFLVARLASLGLGAIDRIAADTCADPGRFFSYRRACLNGEPDYGRQLSVIALI